VWGGARVVAGFCGPRGVTYKTTSRVVQLRKGFSFFNTRRSKLELYADIMRAFETYPGSSKRDLCTNCPIQRSPSRTRVTTASLAPSIVVGEGRLTSIHFISEPQLQALSSYHPPTECGDPPDLRSSMSNSIRFFFFLTFLVSRTVPLGVSNVVVLVVVVVVILVVLSPRRWRVRCAKDYSYCKRAVQVESVHPLSLKAKVPSQCWNTRRRV